MPLHPYMIRTYSTCPDHHPGLRTYGHAMSTIHLATCIPRGWPEFHFQLDFHTPPLAIPQNIKIRIKIDFENFYLKKCQKRYIWTVSSQQNQTAVHGLLHAGPTIMGHWHSQIDIPCNSTWRIQWAWSRPLEMGPSIWLVRKTVFSSKKEEILYSFATPSAPLLSRGPSPQNPQAMCQLYHHLNFFIWENPWRNKLFSLWYRQSLLLFCKCITPCFMQVTWWCKCTHFMTSLGQFTCAHSEYQVKKIIGPLLRVQKN